jgi:amidohydrolase
MGCQVDVEIKRITPAMINNEDIAGRVQQVARQILPGSDHTMENYVTMGGEDMAFILEKVPGCFIFVGSNNKSRGLDYGHHHPKFDIDEEALWHGAGLMAAAAADFLK